MIAETTRRRAAIVALLIAAYVVSMSAICVRKVDRFVDVADLVIFEQSLWNTLHGRVMRNSIEGGNHLGVHMSPVLFLVLPAYALWQDPRLLMVVQTLALGLAAWPLYALAAARLRSEWAGVFVAAAYLLCPAVQGANTWGFYPANLSILPLLAAVYFAYAGRPVAFGLAMALAVSCKEEVALCGVLMALPLWCMGRKRWAVACAVACGLWLAVSMFAIMPALRPEGRHIAQLAQERFGHLHNVGDVLRQVASADTLKYLATLLALAALLPLASPMWLLPAAATVAANVLSGYFFQRRFLGPYASPVVPFLFIAAIEAMRRLSRPMEGRGVRLAAALAVVSATGLAFSDAAKHNFLDAPFWSTAPLPPERLATAKQIVAQAPPRASIVASRNLAHHLARREHICTPVLPEYLTRGEGPDYILLDNKLDLTCDAAEVRPIVQRRYQPVWAKDGFMVLKRKPRTHHTARLPERILIDTIDFP